MQRVVPIRGANRADAGERRRTLINGIGDFHTRRGGRAVECGGLENDGGCCTEMN